MSKEFENLDGEGTAILNRQGWNFVTSYKSRDGGTGSTAYNSAIEKSNSIERQTGIRAYVDDGHTIFEVWEKW